jgi:N-acetylneuraminate lyase
VKFTDHNLFELGKAMDVADGRFQLLFGLDEMLLGALALGVVGGVGGTYALAPHVYHNLLSAFAAGDWEQARHWQRTSRKLVSVILEIGVVPAIKAGMKFHGIDCGPVRAPLDDVTPEQMESITRAIQEMT